MQDSRDKVELEYSSGGQVCKTWLLEIKFSLEKLTHGDRYFTCFEPITIAVDMLFV